MKQGKSAAHQPPNRSRLRVSTAPDPRERAIENFCDQEGRDDARNADQSLDSHGGIDTPPPKGPPGGAGDGGGGGLDPTKLALANCLEQNDTGNAKRLRLWFGEEFLNVEVADSPTSGLGLHYWTGTHWDQVTGYRKVQLLAQETARRIAYECELFEMTPAERQAVGNADDGAAEEASDRSPEETTIMLAKQAEHAFRARKTARLEVFHFVGQRATAWSYDCAGVAALHGSTDGAGRRPALDQLSQRHAASLFRARPGMPGRKLRRRMRPRACRASCSSRTIARDLISKVMPVDYDPNANCPKFMAHRRSAVSRARDIAISCGAGTGSA